jgi:hypothetical protein
MLPNQRRKGPKIDGREPLGPVRLGESLLHHQGVDVDETVLQKVQGEHADLVVFTAIAGEFATLSEEHEVVGPVPLLYDSVRLIAATARRYPIPRR